MRCILGHAAADSLPDEHDPAWQAGNFVAGNKRTQAAPGVAASMFSCCACCLLLLTCSVTITQVQRA